jgi:hypothetical protein
MKRLAAVLATTILAVALGVSAASAAAPQRYHDTFVFSDTIDCSQFDPAWNFHDDFVDFYDVRGQVWLNAAGDPIRAIDHVHHVSNDVNSLTGFTLHEHNHFLAVTDFVKNTVTLSGAINIMQRPGAGEVIHTSGHKILNADTGEPIVEHGPNMADDIDFCRAVAP